MAFKYKELKTGKIVSRKTPMPKEKRQEYVLLSYSANTMIKSNEVTKK